MPVNTEIIHNIRNIRDSFFPKITFSSLQKIAEQHTEIASDNFYGQIEALASQFRPGSQSEFESKWEYFYLPLEREGEMICTAVRIFLSYEKIYYISFPDFSRTGGAGVKKGADSIPDDYALIFDEISRFLPFIKEHGAALLDELYPYTWRRGRIRRKYICHPSTLISEKEGDRLLAAYQKHLEKKLSLTEISLNDYLKTAAICYRAAFADDIQMILRRMQTTEISDKILHKHWADGRHGGMLFLEDPDSKEEYMDWLFSRKWEGAHPFEIVYSGNVHGIYLYPPDKEEHRYRVFVVDPFYNHHFLKMVAALMENNIPFVTSGLDKIVEYCRGESYIHVNVPSMREEIFRYMHTDEERDKYFSHIEWDKIQILEAV